MLEMLLLEDSLLENYEEENILDEILPQFFNQENSQNIIEVSKNLINQKSVMYKDMYFHCFDFEKYNKNGKIDVNFFLQDYKNYRWPFHHYRGQTRLQAAMKTADQIYQALDNFLEPVCRDVFVKSQPVSLFTALLAACVQDGENEQVLRTRDMVRQAGNLERIMERKDSEPCAVGVYLRLT